MNLLLGLSRKRSMSGSFSVKKLTAFIKLQCAYTYATRFVDTHSKKICIEWCRKRCFTWRQRLVNATISGCVRPISLTRIFFESIGNGLGNSIPRYIFKFKLVNFITINFLFLQKYYKIIMLFFFFALSTKHKFLSYWKWKHKKICMTFLLMDSIFKYLIYFCQKLSYLVKLFWL